MLYGAQSQCLTPNKHAWFGHHNYNRHESPSFSQPQTTSIPHLPLECRRSCVQCSFVPLRRSRSVNLSPRRWFPVQGRPIAGMHAPRATRAQPHTDIQTSVTRCATRDAADSWGQWRAAAANTAVAAVRTASRSRYEWQESCNSWYPRYPFTWEAADEQSYHPRSAILANDYSLSGGY